AVAADGDADGAWAAALPLRLPDGVQDALADALEGPVRAAEAGKLRRQRVLDVHVLAAAALEDEANLELVLLPLPEVQDRRARPEVVAGVLAGQGVHRIGPELAAPGGLRHRLPDLLLHPDLVGAHRRLDLEGRHAGVLADGPFGGGRLVDVRRNDGQGLRRAAARL